MTHKNHLGIYIHIPFCLQKCLYCDFCSFPRAEASLMEQYVDALTAQMVSWAGRCAEYEVDTVYFGGGTPTVLPLSQWERLFDILRRHFRILPDAEITAETNPATANETYLRVLRQLGINRLSMGVQSANAIELQALGRAHTFPQAQATFADARAAGFDNISLDVMLGIPHQTRESLAYTLGELITLAPEHLSAYLLKIEDGTPFGRMRDTLPLPDEDLQCDLYTDTVSTLAAAGYARYEISNFARADKHSRHNLRYWLGRPYLGLGLAAHSDFDGKRFAAGNNMAAYLGGVWLDETQTALISPEERRAEYIMLRLRLESGISLSDYRSRFHRDLLDDFGHVLTPYRRAHLLREDPDTLALTTQGMLLSNTILADMLGEV